MLSNSRRCAAAAGPPLISLTCTTSSLLPARGSPSARRTAPIAARSASRPMRPMPLMPTRIHPPLRRSADGVADLIEALLQRHSVERSERQAREDLEATPDHAIELVEQGDPLNRR